MAKPSRRHSRRKAAAVENAKQQSEPAKASPPADDAAHYLYLYAAMVAVAVTCARIDIVALAVPSRYVASWWRFLFVIIVCINVRNHATLGHRPWQLRWAAYVLCNFAGMTVTQTIRGETLGYLRSLTPWQDVASAGLLVEALVVWKPAAQATSLMALRGLCGFPVAVWKCWSVRQHIHYAYTASVSWAKVAPMVTSDMYASGIALACIAHAVSTRSLLPTRPAQLQWPIEIAATVAATIMIVHVWHSDDLLLGSLGYTAMLLFNIHKFCGAPLTYLILARARKVV
ncbi:hypothetical protein SPRG_04050 [Saprolegnia parasitica CBS 223.65]|uniref:Uncharacterized protein n=1 Tax=Saprolegnia parasitica (strain CBS 223.65) TaxID=695850 RepID=A0A067CQA0_SAPPC|nr:hypothetical protein SPRG_04050 [Saprolegnia parasitica CBS 223.65]KDO31435.1 hypothetical protein SPRG_04050 [Saprolegnia parasitica CBS 223.65]|eukprot:XP_012198030.1 hypothetical protein SPRG_04050 [Saprolegnia parasitica CBS 223.65]